MTLVVSADKISSQALSVRQMPSYVSRTGFECCLRHPCGRRTLRGCARSPVGSPAGAGSPRAVPAPGNGSQGCALAVLRHVDAARSARRGVTSSWAGAFICYHEGIPLVRLLGHRSDHLSTAAQEPVPDVHAVVAGGDVPKALIGRRTRHEYYGRRRSRRRYRCTPFAARR